MSPICKKMFSIAREKNEKLKPSPIKDPPVIYLGIGRDRYLYLATYLGEISSLITVLEMLTPHR